MNEFVNRLIERLILESSGCKVYKLINPNKEEVAEFNAYKKAISIVKELAEEYNNGWIAVEDGLPKSNDIYEVTVQFKDGEISTDFAFYDYVKDDWTLGNVIAWRKNTAPYQPKGK